MSISPTRGGSWNSHSHGENPCLGGLDNIPAEQDLSLEPCGPEVGAPSLNHTEATGKKVGNSSSRLPLTTKSRLDGRWVRGWISLHHRTKAHRLQNVLHCSGRRSQVKLFSERCWVLCPPLTSVVLNVGGGGVAPQGTLSNV